MKMSGFCKILSSLLLLALLWGSRSAPAEAEPRLTVSLRWSQPQTEIYSPVIAAGRLAFVRRFHWPDGHEAEMTGPASHDELEARAVREPRFNDPQVVLLQGSRIQTVDWGWCPAIAPRGDRLVYVRQERPMTGLRVLAETLRGDTIHERHLSNSADRQLAAPTAGYLWSPTYDSTGRRVLYALCDGLNGAYGGQVGAAVVEADGRARTLLAPKRTHDLYHIVQADWCGPQVVALRGVPTTGGTYLADRYEWTLLDPEARRTLARLGTFALGEGPAMWCTMPPTVLILAKQAFEIDPRSGQRLRTISPRPQGVPSPDGALIAVVKNKTVHIGRFGRAAAAFRVTGEVSEIRWSRDSRQLAIVSTPGPAEAFTHDELVVLDVHR